MSSNREVSGTFLSDAEKMVRDLLKRTTICCPNCEHFKPEPMLQCGLNGMRPPSSIIAFGCEMFKDNDIPF